MLPAADAPILFFDSGLGGLTVLGPTRALLPTAPVVYAADYAGLPYGKKATRNLRRGCPRCSAVWSSAISHGLR